MHQSKTSLRGCSFLKFILFFFTSPFPRLERLEQNVWTRRAFGLGTRYTLFECMFSYWEVYKKNAFFSLPFSSKSSAGIGRWRNCVTPLRSGRLWVLQGGFRYGGKFSYLWRIPKMELDGGDIL